MYIFKSLLILLPSMMLLGCGNSSDSHSSGVTSSQAVGGESYTMEQCKKRIDETSKKYNVTYKVNFDEPDYFSGYIVKDGIQTDLLVSCDKKGDYYQGLFEIPD